jgi:NADPH:quinone reductase-like Zn-dependent oxidoreductase/quercetin dioxygenase-like cupin family protein
MPHHAAPSRTPSPPLTPAGAPPEFRASASAAASRPDAGAERTRSVAARIHAYGGADAVQIDEVPVPAPGPGQVLVAVGAAGVNGLDWKIREGYVRDAYPLAFPSPLGLELAGAVVETGAGVTRFHAGDRVMGLAGGLGAYADFAVVDETQLVPTPPALSDVEAAALPVALLTAAQAMQAGGVIQAGSTVLIHGAAGGVGGFAVQLAKAAGATVFATASSASRGHVLALGADVVIDYRAERFEERAAAVDLVLDLVGGETLDRSWSVLAPHGVVVSTAAPDVASRAPEGRRGVWLMMRPDAEQLARLADDVARGALRSTIAEVAPLSGLAAAIERNRTGHAPGKIVLDLHAPAYPPIPPDDPGRRLAVARPDTDAALPHLGIGTGTYTILLSGRDTAGRYALIDMHVPPGGGPPPHRHDFEEMFTVLEGEIEVTFRGETVPLRAGETVNVPANAPHAFRNVADAPARLLCMCTPAGQEEFFAEVGAPVAGRTTPPPALAPDARAALIARTIALAPRYRSELLLP